MSYLLNSTVFVVQTAFPMEYEMARLRNADYLPMSGQIMDTTLVVALKQRNTNAEKAALREGRILQDW
ncbi:transposase [Acetobacter orleanensis NRIC 0473]|uniref:Uncharacterized protein n=1 Tax=Acetobacter orleanensis TaxID=104099 RepID=A0A4Y3TPU7_9PROT|nr:transposase [Acetobacter orleanensis JCM 7639]GBR29420.1 transposase [Acetobacter orleanensis NRIC 0473]GEB83812.1 hypothetical protein AOR01nite_22890 [Acetobacter orleanensis]